MNAVANKQIVLDAYAALNAGDPAGYFARLADDVKLTMFGNHRLSRTYHGKDEFMSGVVSAMRERLAGAIKLHITNAVADGDQVVVEAQGEVRTKDGRDYNNTYCFVVRVENGTIKEIREYMDTELTKSVFGERL